MKKYTFYIPAVFVLLLSISCTNEAGTPPELVLSFSNLDCYTSGSDIVVDYKLTNDGEEDLENCKIQFGINNIGGDTYSYKYWTNGVDIDEGDSHTESNEDTSFNGTVDDFTIIAAGFDSADSKGVVNTTIIKISAE